MLEALRTYLREGVSELSGFGEEIAELREAQTDAKLLARRVEELSFGDLGGMGSGGGDFGVSRATHREMVRKSYLHYFGNAVVRRTADLQTYYVFGTGVARPSYRAADQGKDAEGKAGQACVDRLWTDEENRATLLGVQAQYEKSLEKQAQGNVFLTVDRDDRRQGRPGPDAPTNLKISDLPEREITEIVCHPLNKKVPLYYRREFTTAVWSHDLGGYTPGAMRVRYYRHWRNDAPRDGEVFDGEEWRNPPEALIADARVYHVKVNATSEMRFGIPEMHSYLQWAGGIADYMSHRMSTVKAIAQMAMQLKVRGGPRAVGQAAAQLQDVQRLAARVDSGEGLPRERAAQDRTRIPVSNESAQLQPMVTDTGAQSAATDVATMRSMAAAGSGIPGHHLGGDGPALASSISQDLPLNKMVRAAQELWREVLRDLTGYALEGEGHDPDRVEVTMPPLTDRDASEIGTIFTQFITAVDPDVSNRALVRFALGELLDALGKQNARELVDELVPDQWKLPAEQPGARPASAARADRGAAGGPAEEIADAGYRAERHRQLGRVRSADERGGGQRAQARSHERARRLLEASPEELVEAMGVALAELDEIVDGEVVER